MSLPATIPALELLGANQRAALLEVLLLPHSAALPIRRDQILEELLSARVQPAPRLSEPSLLRDAAAARTSALSAWFANLNEERSISHDLYLSAELFSEIGNLRESALSRVLLGLFHAEDSPALALPSLEVATPELDDEWLAFAILAKGLCLARLGRGEEALRLQQEQWWRDRVKHPLSLVHAQWLEARVALATGSADAPGALARIVRRLLANSLINEAALAMSDLAGASDDTALLADLYADFRARVPITGPDAAALSAVQDLGSGNPRASRPVRSLVSTLCRYPVDSITQPATGPASGSSDA